MEGVWRWNVDAVCSHFSWMYEAAHQAAGIRDSLNRYHQISSCLYFGFGCLEAFLDEQIRKRFLKARPEEDLLRSIKKTQFRTEITSWASVCCPSVFRIGLEVIQSPRFLNFQGNSALFIPIPTEALLCISPQHERCAEMNPFRRLASCLVIFPVANPNSSPVLQQTLA